MFSHIGPFDVAAILIVCAAFFGWLNHRFLGLPLTIGLTAMGAVASIAVVAVDALLPAEPARGLRDFIEHIDFSAALLQGMLSFLLFAGALHTDLRSLRRLKWTIAFITLFGVLASTALVGFGARFLASAAGVELPLLPCLVFGALISPTDPVAVLGIFKAVRVPAALEAIVTGESLFNDGLGIVLFILLLELSSGSQDVSWWDALRLFSGEALGGAMLGGALGWIAFGAMRAIDEHNLEVMITLALVMGGYALAQHIGVNGPIAMAVAGLIIGNQGRALAMSDRTRDYVSKFWSLIDDILNAVLFLLIGFEVIVVLNNAWLWPFALAAIPLVALARAVSVGPPLLWLRRRPDIPRGSYTILVLGGVRGGISIALALSLPAGPHSAAIVVATYGVVLFSVLLQAPAAGVAARRLFAGEARRP